MKSLIFSLALSLSLFVGALAQDKSKTEPKTEPKIEVPKQSLLKPEQVAQLKELEQNLKLVESQLSTLQAQKAAGLMALEALLRDYFIVNRVNADEFEVKVQSMDEKQTVYGFVPKQKPPTKK